MFAGFHLYFIYDNLSIVLQYRPHRRHDSMPRTWPFIRAHAALTASCRALLLPASYSMLAMAIRRCCLHEFDDDNATRRARHRSTAAAMLPSLPGMRVAIFAPPKVGLRTNSMIEAQD